MKLDKNMKNHSGMFSVQIWTTPLSYFFIILALHQFPHIWNSIYQTVTTTTQEKYVEQLIECQNVLKLVYT